MPLWKLKKEIRVKRKSHINFIISIGALTLGFLTSAHSQRLGPSREQCRKEAAEWGGQTGEPIDITSLPLNELDRRRNELLSCIPGDYDNIDRYSRLERAYATPKCNRLSFFFNHHDLIEQVHEKDEKGICCRIVPNSEHTK
jgi:hypothetical protein